jgi:hypothetical protein
MLFFWSVYTVNSHFSPPLHQEQMTGNTRSWQGTFFHPLSNLPIFAIDFLSPGAPVTAQGKMNKNYFLLAAYLTAFSPCSTYSWAGKSRV